VGVDDGPGLKMSINGPVGFRFTGRIKVPLNLVSVRTDGRKIPRFNFTVADTGGGHEKLIPVAKAVIAGFARVEFVHQIKVIGHFPLWIIPGHFDLRSEVIGIKITVGPRTTFQIL
jgi:hypothetical protein